MDVLPQNVLRFSDLHETLGQGARQILHRRHGVRTMPSLIFYCDCSPRCRRCSSILLCRCKCHAAARTISLACGAASTRTILERHPLAESPGLGAPGRAPACLPRPSERAARPCAFERASEERTGGTRQAGRKRTAAMCVRQDDPVLSAELLEVAFHVCDPDAYSPPHPDAYSPPHPARRCRCPGILIMC